MTTPTLALVLTLLALSLCLTNVAAIRKDKAKIIKEDVKYIRCDVCRILASEMHQKVKQMRESNKKLMEVDVIQSLEEVCDPDSDGGEWLSRLDITNKGREGISVVDKGVIGHCGEECRTAAHACEGIMGDADTDVAEQLWNGIKKEKLIVMLCNELSSACVKPPQPPSSYKRKDFAFKPKTEQEIEMDRMVRGMRDVPGMQGAQMYSRDDYIAKLAQEMEMEGMDNVMPSEYQYLQEELKAAGKQEL